MIATPNMKKHGQAAASRLSAGSGIFSVAVIWSAAVMAPTAAGNVATDTAQDAWLTYLEARAVDLESTACLEPLIKQLGSARVVLLGESTHGTREYYAWRKRISRVLIEEHGFRFIAVEGDWPSCYAVNRFAKRLPGKANDVLEALSAFQRWPRWMWANPVVERLAAWLAEHNETLPEEERVGFYGLDVYAMMDSIDAVIAYLDGENADRAREAYADLLRYRDDVHGYPRALAGGAPSSQGQTERILEKLRRLAPGRDRPSRQRRAWFEAKMNALAVRNGERHYRAMLRRDSDSWNARAEHMAEALDRLLAYHGPDSRAIVWAHNTHVGDARATTMAVHGMVNIGQLARERYGADQAASVGFATYGGQVMAGTRWGAPGNVMQIPDAAPDSFEAVFQRLGRPAWFVQFENAETMAAPLLRPMGHRAVGVVYNPAQEQRNYVPTVLPRRYDALIYLERTEPLMPLPQTPEGP